MKLRSLSLILFSLLLLISGCGSVTLPDTEVCAIQGHLPQGMFCSTTVSRRERNLDFDQTIDFLHASETHGAALCQSSKDWTKIKTALEQACVLLGKRCKKKVVGDVDSIIKTIDKIQSLTAEVGD